MNTNKLDQLLTTNFIQCTVANIPSGSFPKLINVRVAGTDGAIQSARWFGTPALAVGDTIPCRINQADSNILEIVAGGNSLTGFMNWRDVWEPGATYLPNDMLYDEGWLMVANTETTDRPAPQPLGAPFWQFDDLPAWVGASFAGQVAAANRWTTAESIVIEGIRWDVKSTAAAVEYIGILSDETNGNILYTTGVFNGDDTLVTLGWNQSLIPTSIIPAGIVLQATLISLNSSSTTPIGPFVWNYSGTSNQSLNPGLGNVNRHSNDSVVRLNKTDNGSTDRSVALTGVTVGTVLTLTDSVTPAEFRQYYITTITDNGLWIAYTVTLEEATSGLTSGNLMDVDFAVPVASPTAYNSEPVKWAVLPSWASTAQGRLQLGSGAVVASNNGFGTDIEVQRADISDDYDLAAFSGGGVGGGGGGTTSTKENITVTVGPSPGKDFTAIQAAVDSFIGFRCTGCVVELEQGASFNESVDMDGVTTTTMTGLEIRGDTRDAVGITYTHGSPEANRLGVANMGGGGTVTMSTTGPTINIAQSGGASNFIAAGIVNGDLIEVRTAGGVRTTHTVTAVGGTAISVSPAPPVTAVNGVCVTFMPNVSLTNVSGDIITTNIPMTIRGVDIHNSNNIGLTINAGQTALSGCVIRDSGNNGINAFYSISNLFLASGQTTGHTTLLDNNVNGLAVTHGASCAVGTAVIIVGGPRGVESDNGSSFGGSSIIIIDCAIGVRARRGASAISNNTVTMNCGTGFNSDLVSYVSATNTIARAIGNTTNHNPAVSNTFSASGGMITIS